LLSPHFYPPIPLIHNAEAMGFNKRKMEDDRRQEAEKKAAARRATDARPSCCSQKGAIGGV
jgi:hypothetical protein